MSFCHRGRKHAQGAGNRDASTLSIVPGLKIIRKEAGVSLKVVEYGRIFKITVCASLLSDQFESCIYFRLCLLLGCRTDPARDSQAAETFIQLIG